MIKQKGVVLLITLIILQVCALLSLYALQESWLVTRLTHSVWHKHQFQNAIEQALKNVEQEMQLLQPLCMIPVIPTVRLKKQPMAWWEEKSCVGNFMTIHYYYVVELLGTDGCAVVDQSKNSTAIYYRLTLLGLDDGGRKALIQSTIIKANAQSDKCDGLKYQVDVGRQSLIQLFQA